MAEKPGFLAAITYPDLTAFEEALAPVTESYGKQYGDEFTVLYNQLKG